jgi:hypothetical protein
MQALKFLRKPAAQASPPPIATPYARSALLMPLPDRRVPGRRLRILLRLVLISALIGFLVILIDAIRHKRLGEHAVAQALYQAHDQIYLPIKGYTFTQFYPTSLIWYTLAAALFSLWLGFFAFDSSVVRRPHIRFARAWVRSLPSRRLLVAVAKLLKRMGLPPDLLLVVVEHERDQALWHVAPANRGASRRLIRLTRLLIGLRLLYDDRTMLLRALLDWQDAMLLLRFHQDQLGSKFAGDVVPICRRVLQPSDQSLLETIWFQGPAFEHAGCIADLLRQAALAGDPEKILADPADLQALDGATPAVLIGALVAATEWRCRRIDGLRARLESGLRDPAAAIGTIDGVADELGLAAQPNAELPFLGAIALRSALAAAHAANSADLALAAIEALEALRLALDCFAFSPKIPPALLRTIECARVWAGDLPSPHDYQMAASLAQQAATRQRQRYETDMMDNQLLRYADDVVGERIDILYQAAGSERDTNLLQQRDKAP